MQMLHFLFVYCHCTLFIQFYFCLHQSLSQDSTWLINVQFMHIILDTVPKIKQTEIVKCVILLYNVTAEIVQCIGALRLQNTLIRSFADLRHSGISTLCQWFHPSCSRLSVLITYIAVSADLFFVKITET